LVLVWLLKYNNNHTDYDILYLGSGLIFFNFICLIEQRKGKLFWKKGGRISKGICNVKPSRWWKKLCL